MVSDGNGAGEHMGSMRGGGSGIGCACRIGVGTGSVHRELVVVVEVVCRRCSSESCVWSVESDGCTSIDDSVVFSLVGAAVVVGEIGGTMGMIQLARRRHEGHTNSPWLRLTNRWPWNQCCYHKQATNTRTNDNGEGLAHMAVEERVALTAVPFRRSHTRT